MDTGEPASVGRLGPKVLGVDHEAVPFLFDAQPCAHDPLLVKRGSTRANGDFVACDYA